MLFADATLARRLEGAECAMMADFGDALRPQRDVLVVPLAGGLAICAGPGSPFNKVIGIGLGTPLHEPELAEVESAFAARRTPVQVELSELADPEVGKLLTRRGYELVGFENLLGRSLGACPTGIIRAGAAPLDPASPGRISTSHPNSPAIHPSEPGPTFTTLSRRLPLDRLLAAPAPAARAGALALEVGLVGAAGSAAGELDTWIDVLVAGFACPDTGDGPPSHESFDADAIRKELEGTRATRGFRRYVAFRAGVAVGAASMRVHERTAMLCGATTLPAERRQGVQSALLSRRLGDARELGCDVATITTLPGSKSHENAQRNGFELLYARAVLVRRR